MAKYIFQLRRGWKDDATGRNDWAAYEALENHIKPLEGELVLEYDNGVPRLKIGDGVNEFSALPYMSVDSFILPTQASITLYGSEDTENADQNQWTEEVNENGNLTGRYKQIVTVSNATITPNSKVDLNPTAEQLVRFYQKDVTFVAENDDGEIAVYCVGVKPANTYQNIPVTVTEVTTNG